MSIIALILALSTVSIDKPFARADCAAYAEEFGQALGEALVSEFGDRSLALTIDCVGCLLPGQDSLAIRQVSLSAARAATIPLLVAPRSWGPGGTSSTRWREALRSFDASFTVLECRVEGPTAAVRLATGSAEWLLTLVRDADEWKPTRFYLERIY